MLEVLQSNIIEIITVLLTGFITYVVSIIKRKYEEYVNTDTKRKIVKTVVGGIEQIYKEMDGNSKLVKAKENIISLLNEKNLSISELELNMLIEEVVNSFNQNKKED